MRAIGYIRVSTAEQAVHGISLAAQQAKIEAYCAVKDLELIKIIEEGGKSAKDLKRPGFKTVLELVAKGQTDAVVIVKLDRAFRNTVDALSVAKDFDKRGVALHSVEESLDTRSAIGKFAFTLMASLAELERGIISERTRAALAHKKERGGKLGGGVPFGYDAVDGKLVRNAAEQRVKARIVRLRKSGVSLQKIAATLNSDKIPAKRGGSWTSTQVDRVAKAAIS